MARIAITVGSESWLGGYDYYVEAVRSAGGEPRYAKPGCKPLAVWDDCDALLVTGGTDIDPSHYGEPKHEEVIWADYERDITEINLLKSAWKRNIPVLAICRGFQALNVIRGGILQQHIQSDTHRPGFDGKAVMHALTITPGSWLNTLLRTEETTVNSRHHQAVRPNMVGKGLVIAAMSPDGLVESIESPAHTFMVGVQWHPERPEMDGRMDALFHALVAAGYARLAARQEDTRVPVRLPAQQALVTA